MGRWLVWALVAAWAAPAFAQSDVERLDRVMRDAERQYHLLANPALSIGERAILEYGGLVNFSLLAIDDIQQRTHILRQTDVHLTGRLNIDNAHEFFGRLRFTYRDWNDGDDFDGRGDRLLYPLSDRWYYRFDLRRAVAAQTGELIDHNLTLQIGRQYVHWASGLVFSNQLYAARGTVEWGPWELEALAGLTPGSSFVDFDSSRPDFDRDTDRGFFGGKLTYRGIPRHRPYVYLIHQQDYNNDAATLQFGALSIPTRFDYNSTYAAIGSNGTLTDKLLYSAEFIYQFGDTLSTSLEPGGVTAIAQTRDDISAWAARGELVYLVKDANLTRIDLETIFASGDPDRDFHTSNTLGGNAPGTTDRAFNAFGFARTGLAFGAPLSNLMLYRLGASTFPLRGQKAFRHLQIGLDVLAFNKMRSSAPINEPTSDNRFLGWELDLFAAWRVTSDISLNVRYGVFFPGTAIEAEHDPRHFLFTGITYSF